MMPSSRVIPLCGIEKSEPTEVLSLAASSVYSTRMVGRSASVMTATLLPGAIRSTNIDNAERRNVISLRGGGAVVHEQRDVHRFGGARHPQHLATRAVFRHDERLGAQPFDRFARLVQRR